MRFPPLLLVLAFLLFLPVVSTLPHNQYSDFAHPQFRASLGASDASISLSDTIVYHTAYYNLPETNDWVPFSLGDNFYPNSDSWLDASGFNDSLPEFPANNESYILFYSCTLIGNQDSESGSSWDCHNATGSPNGFWQLVVVNQNSSLVGGFTLTEGDCPGSTADPYAAVDGDFGTWWSCYYSDSWLQLDFSEPQVLDVLRIAFYNGHQRHYSFDIQTSVDGVSWTNVYSGLSSGATTELESFYFPVISTQHLRVVGYSNDVNSFNAYTELSWNYTNDIALCDNNVQDSSEGGVDCGGPCSSCPTCDDGTLNQGEEQVDCGGPCTACPTCSDNLMNGDEVGVDCGGSCPAACDISFSQSDCYTGQEDVSLLLDGSLETGWGCYDSGSWVQFNLATPVLLDTFSIAFYNGHQRIYNFEVAVSDDGTSWSTVYAGQSSGTTTELEDFFFQAVTTSHIRLTGYLYSGGHWNSYREVSWSFNNMTIDCNDGIQNGGETGIDCGGICGACGTCFDFIQNCHADGTCEEDVDCGGPCNPCPTCQDTLRNGGETGVDCGGPCNPCPPTCDDGILNQDEDGVDCGGVCGIDCCQNNYADYALGELGVDCDGVCSDSCFVGTTYFVANDGDDTSSGTSPSNPWRTIAHVNSIDLQPGDAVLFKRGDVWRIPDDAPITLAESGVTGAPLYFGSYGDGPLPRLLGSLPVSSWTEIEPNIWRSATPIGNPYEGGYQVGGEVSFEYADGSAGWGRQRDSLALMTNEFDWYWTDNTLYVYAPDNPATLYASVEVPRADGAAYLNKHSYVSFDSLEMRYLRTWGINGGYGIVPANGLRVTNCHIGNIGVRGDSAGYGVASWYSDALFAHNEIHDCGRRGLSLVTYTNSGVTVSNVTVENNHFYSGWHTTATDIQTNAPHTYTDWTIRNNVIDDSMRASKDINYGCWASSCTSNGIFIQVNGGSMQNFRIYNNIIIGSTARSILVRGGDATNNIAIWHNTIYGSHPDADPYSLLSLNSATDFDLRNNIVYSTIPATGNLARCVLEEGDFSYAHRDTNLYFVDDPQQPITGSPAYGDWNVLMSEWADWRSNTGYEPNSPTPANPLFVDAKYGDFSLQSSSPAIAAGTPLPDVTHDIFGNPRDPSNPTIGAVESMG